MKRIYLLLMPILLVVGLFSLNLTTTNAQTFGTNWTAQFYNSTTPGTGTLVASTSYPNGLNFNWPGQPTDSNGLPLTTVPADNFSAIFSSSQTFAAGVATFSITVDDRATVTIGGQPVWDASTVAGFAPGQTYQFSANFAAPGAYSIQVNFIEFTSVAIIQLSWTQGTTGGIPTTPGVATATPGPTGPIGSVVNVRGLSLRTGPYLGASFIGVLRPDIAYSVLAQNSDERGGFTWYKVNTGEQVGWASGRYLLVTNGEPPVEGTVFEALSNPSDTGVVAVTRAIMNFRVRPSYRSPRIAGFEQLPWGAEAELLGRTVQGGRNFWFLVRWQGQVGWIYAPYVGVRGNLNIVPVY